MDVKDAHKVTDNLWKRHHGQKLASPAHRPIIGFPQSHQPQRSIPCLSISSGFALWQCAIPFDCPVFDDLAQIAYRQKDVLSANKVWGEYLAENGYVRYEPDYPMDVYKFCCNYALSLFQDHLYPDRNQGTFSNPYIFF